MSRVSIQAEISAVRSSSLRTRYFSATAACFLSGSSWSCSSSILSPTRVSVSSVAASFLSASSLRKRKREMPAASSKISRRSVLFAETISAMRPCPMME